MHGTAPCINFGATRPDLVVARLLLDVVQPMAIEAAIVAEQQASHRDEERKRALELERQQTEYEVQLARRRYESVDPDNRLVAAELEARWNAALARLRDCDARLEAARAAPSTAPDRACLMSLAKDLESAWNAAVPIFRTGRCFCAFGCPQGPSNRPPSPRHSKDGRVAPDSRSPTKGRTACATRSRSTCCAGAPRSRRSATCSATAVPRPRAYT